MTEGDCISKSWEKNHKNTAIGGIELRNEAGELVHFIAIKHPELVKSKGPHRISITLDQNSKPIFPPALTFEQLMQIKRRRQQQPPPTKLTKTKAPVLAARNPAPKSIPRPKSSSRSKNTSSPEHPSTSRCPSPPTLISSPVPECLISSGNESSSDSESSSECFQSPKHVPPAHSKSSPQPASKAASPPKSTPSQKSQHPQKSRTPQKSPSPQKSLSPPKSSMSPIASTSTTASTNHLRAPSSPKSGARVILDHESLPNGDNQIVASIKDLRKANPLLKPLDTKEVKMIIKSAPPGASIVLPNGFVIKKSRRGGARAGAGRKRSKPQIPGNEAAPEKKAKLDSQQQANHLNNTSSSSSATVVNESVQ